MVQMAVIVTSIVLSLTSLFFLSEVHRQLNGGEEQRQLANFWKQQVALEHLNKTLLSARFADFKQEVGTYLYKYQDKKMLADSQKKIRDLASVIPHEKVTIDYKLSAETLLKNGKNDIVNSKYEKGMESLENLIFRFPDSHHVVEAHYLIMEAYINLHKKEKVIERIDKLVELFPQSRLTGYALLKLGGIYENDSRLEEALHVYKTIILSFRDKTLISKANHQVKLLEF